MKRLAIVFAAQLALSVGVARAADRSAPAGQTGLGAVVSTGELKATPEMWFYEQAMRQYKDPKAQVRAREEFRTQQRIRRLESMRWFGFSNSRPQASGDPWNYDYSPHWVSNPGYFPSRWNGVAQSAW
jgi:hypothetical protein